MQFRVKAVRVGAGEPFQKFLFVAPVQDVIANVIRFGEVVNDQIMAVAISAGLGSGGLGFLVLGFAMDDAGDVFLGILAHALPDAHHVAAGGVHHQAALGLQLFAGADLGAKRGDDHGIAGFQMHHFRLRGLGRDDLDAHVADLVVDLGVVNDLAEQVDGGFRGDIGEIFPGGIGEVNGPFDPVAKAEFLGQFHGQIAGGQHAAIGAHALDQFAAIMRQHLGLDRLHDVGPAQVDFLPAGLILLQSSDI